MHRSATHALLLLALLAIAPFASPQAAGPAGEELNDLIGLLETRALTLVLLPEPSKEQTKLLKFVKKQLVKLEKPSTTLSKDAKNFRKVVKPLQKKLADDVPVQQELVIATARLLESCELRLAELATEFLSADEGPPLNKAKALKAKGESLLAKAASQELMRRRVGLIAKAAKRAEQASMKVALAQPQLPNGCSGTLVGSDDFVSALLGGEAWSPTTATVWLTYAPDGVTLRYFSVSFGECPDPYHQIRFSLNEPPQLGFNYYTSIHEPTALSVTATSDNSGTSFTLYFGGVGLSLSHFDPVNESAVGTFYGSIPLAPPAQGSLPLTNGNFSIQGFNTYVQPE
ncbi:MAG: hypothetical protein DHS20C15_29440 [Planctomycetota bacterium]|nr:MAG: hypothetical protein DHS20C15_29440 [Planctomycetota bacterium]